MPRTRQEAEAQALAEHGRRHAARNGQASIIDAFNVAHPIEGLLERHGYTKGPRGRYVRPGGTSESVSVRDGRSFHWSTNDPLNDGRTASGCGVHDAFDVFKLLEHDGDERAAVRAAAEAMGLATSGDGAGRAPSEPWPEPRPLPSGLPPVAPFELRLLPDALRGWVADVAERMQCPVDCVAATAMIAAATLVGRKVVIRPKRRDD